MSIYQNQFDQMSKKDICQTKMAITSSIVNINHNFVLLKKIILPKCLGMYVYDETALRAGP